MLTTLIACIMGLGQTSSVDKEIVAFRAGLDSSKMLATFRSTAMKSNVDDRELGIYYTGRYYQRGFEISMFGGGYSIRNSDLGQCIAWLDKGKIIGTNSKGIYASDSLFYLAIVKLEQGYRSESINLLKQIDIKRDSTVFVDAIIWTKDRRYYLGKSFSAGTLRDRAISIIQGLDNTFRDSAVEQFAVRLKAALVPARG